LWPTASPGVPSNQLDLGDGRGIGGYELPSSSSSS
jgi:hypothetical protein